MCTHTHKYISKYVRTAVIGDLVNNSSSKSTIEVSLEECDDFGPGPGFQKKITSPHSSSGRSMLLSVALAPVP